MTAGWFSTLGVTFERPGTRGGELIVGRALCVGARPPPPPVLRGKSEGTGVRRGTRGRSPGAARGSGPRPARGACGVWPRTCELGTRARGVRHGRPFPKVGVRAAEPVDVPALVSHSAPWCAHFVTLWKDPASLGHRGPFHAHSTNKVSSDWSFFVRSFQGGN